MFYAFMHLCPICGHILTILGVTLWHRVGRGGIHDNVKMTFSNTKSIYARPLSFKKLHMNKKGNAFLAKNFMKYINSI